MDAGLGALVPLAGGFLLVLCRCGAAMALLPGLGEASLPATIRVGLALALALLLFPVVQPALPPLPAEPAPLAALVAGELLAGATLGFLARLAVLALNAAGQLISLMAGLSSVLQPDPALGAQEAVVATLFAMAAPAILLATGAHAPALQALADSYRLFPPGGVPLPAGDLASLVSRAAENSLALGLRLAAPFVLAGTLWQIAMGLVARLVPPLQVFFAALPGQVLGGLALLAMLGSGLLRLWAEAAAPIP
jgi:flagellar biosynthesis protein FliR